jgi:KUP system potassium uptake protein
MLNYLGQGALILRRPGTVVNPFFLLVPGGQGPQKLMVVLATIATVIASQAVISGAYSVTQQVIQLGFLPRMTIRHTSQRIIGQIYIPLVNWLLLAAVIILVLTFRSPTGLANAYGIALSAIFATNTLLAFVVFRKLRGRPLWLVIPGATFFMFVELTFFAANMTKLFSGGWFPLLVGTIFFTILTTWRRGRAILTRQRREGRLTLRRYINRLIDDPPIRKAGTAVFLTPSLDIAPTALLNNAEHNGVVHERVILVKIATATVPHIPQDDRVCVEHLRLGFVTITAHYGYQDDPNVVAILQHAQYHGLDLDIAHISYYVDHTSILPTGHTHMARWRKLLFILLHQNSTPVARSFHIPSNRVCEVGDYIEI